MRLESDGKRRFSMGAAHPQGGVDHGPVAQMDPIEITHGDHGSPGDLRGRRGVSNYGKTSCHFRDSLEILDLRERGRTVTRRRLRSQAGGPHQNGRNPPASG
jgi:hypothetical protein